MFIETESDLLSITQCLYYFMWSSVIVLIFCVVYLMLQNMHLVFWSLPGLFGHHYYYKFYLNGLSYLY